MSIILKGIDLPKEGEMHLIISKNGIVCGAEYPCKIRHPYPLNLEAKAIQIPKGHGRLIDMRALFEDLNKYQIEYNADINEVIADAPTILEKEE